MLFLDYRYFILKNEIKRTFSNTSINFYELSPLVLKFCLLYNHNKASLFLCCVYKKIIIYENKDIKWIKETFNLPLSILDKLRQSPNV